MKTVFRFSLILFFICLVAAGSLGFINWLTRPKILAQIRLEEEESLKEVLPQADYFQEVRKDQDILYYKAYKDKELIGVAYKAKAKGYSSIIEAMAGMDLDGKITGIKIINQNETPGLGSRIVEVAEEITILDMLKGKKKESVQKRPWFCEQFRGKIVANLDS